MLVIWLHLLREKVEMELLIKLGLFVGGGLSSLIFRIFCSKKCGGLFEF